MSLSQVQNRPAANVPGIKVLPDWISEYRDITRQPPAHGQWHLVFVTPQMAENWLTRNHADNRRPKPNFIERRAKEITAGHYRLTHQGMAFTTDGTLVDGQHRLQSILVANKGVWTWVYIGLTQDEMLVVDSGAVRTDADAFHLNGLSWVKPGHVAIANAMLASFSGNVRKTARDALRTFIERHKDAIEFAMPRRNMRGYSHTGVRCVLARAYYNCDHEVIKRFDEILLTGEIKGEREQAALRLRDWLLMSNHRKGTMAGLIRKTESALRAFTIGKPLTKLYEAEGELFPLPEEVL